MQRLLQWTSLEFVVWERIKLPLLPSTHPPPSGCQSMAQRDSRIKLVHLKRIKYDKAEGIILTICKQIGHMLFKYDVILEGTTSAWALTLSVKIFSV